MKRVVQRMCIGCCEKKEKKELIRIVLNKEGQINIDKTGKLEGRGAYICDNMTAGSIKGIPSKIPSKISEKRRYKMVKHPTTIKIVK